MPPPPPIPAISSSTSTLNDVIQQVGQVPYCTCTMVRYQDYSFMRSRHNSYCSHASRWSYSSHVIDPLQGLRSASSCMVNQTASSCRNSLAGGGGGGRVPPPHPNYPAANGCRGDNGTTNGRPAVVGTPRHRGRLNRVSSIKSQTTSLRKFEVDLMSADMVDRNSLPPDYLVSSNSVPLSLIVTLWPPVTL